MSSHCSPSATCPRCSGYPSIRYGWRHRGEGPRGYRVGRHVCHRRASVECLAASASASMNAVHPTEKWAASPGGRSRRCMSSTRSPEPKTDMPPPYEACGSSIQPVDHDWGVCSRRAGWGGQDLAVSEQKLDGGNAGGAVRIGKRSVVRPGRGRRRCTACCST